MRHLVLGLVLLACQAPAWPEAFSPDQPCTLTTSLISFWKLDEASGTRADSKSTNDLTDNNTVTQATGIISNAGQFTSANTEYLSRADNAALSTGDIDFSVVGWLYFDSKTTSFHTISKYNSGVTADREWTIFYTTGTDRFDLYVRAGATETQATASTFGAVPTATWIFVVIWHDATANTINIQVNNGGVDSVSHTVGVNDGAASFVIGASSDASGPMNGRIDEVGFWKKVLSSTERTDLYNGGSGNTYNASTFCRKVVLIVGQQPVTLPWCQGSARSRAPGSIRQAIEACHG